MESNNPWTHPDERTPTWVQPVDAATCAALSRELWGMLSASSVDLSVVEFCDYVTGATLAFQRAYADAEWGETHDWMEATETFLAGYMLDYPIRELETAWERQAGPLPIAPQPVTSAVYAVDDEATEQAVHLDDRVDAAGAALALSLDAANIRCRHYGGGVIEVDWSRENADLRVVVGDLGEGLVIDVASQDYDEDGEMGRGFIYDEDIPWSDFARVVDAVTRARAPF